MIRVIPRNLLFDLSLSTVPSKWEVLRSASRRCSYHRCLCTMDKVEEAYRSTLPMLKVFVNGSCQQVRLLRSVGRAGSPEQTSECLVSQVVLSHMANNEALPSGIADMHTFLEENKKLTLAGESGKITSQPIYWAQLNDHFQENRARDFHVYSLGGGQGFDALGIQNALSQQDLKVVASKSIENNPIAAFLGGANGNVIFSDAFSFIEELPPRGGNELRVFHLGNFLSVLRPQRGRDCIIKLSDKMEENDIISIINIRREQTDKLKTLLTMKDTMQGLEGFFWGGHFFRSTISDREAFGKFLIDLGIDIVHSENLERMKIDSGPDNYEMFFSVIIGKKKRQQ